MTAPLRGKTVLCLVLGIEGYGVRRAWGGLIDGFKARGVVPVVAALEAGQLAAKLAGQGAEVAIASRGSGPVVTASGVRKAIQFVRRGAAQIGSAAWLARLARERGAEAILLRSPSEVIMAGLAARRAGIRAFWLLPNAVSDYPLDFNRRIYRFAFNRLNVVPISNSAYTDTTLGPGNFERHHVHLGIDPADFPKLAPAPEVRAALGIGPYAVVIGVFARMVPEKGQLRLLEAVAALGDEAPDIELLLCGGPVDTHYFARIRDFARERGLSARVHLPGPVDDVQHYYRACDLVANTRLDAEPFGFSVIEAMMLGKPILAHKAGGPGETVIDGATGWHIAGPDLESFVVALRRALAERARWPAIGEAARAHALARFNHQRMADDVLAILGGEAER